MKPGIKIVKVRPLVTEEEIRRTMDFDSVLRLYKTAQIRISNWKRGLSLGGGAVIITSAIYLMVNNKIDGMESQKQQVTIVATDSSLIKPVAKDMPADPSRKQVEINRKGGLEKKQVQTLKESEGLAKKSEKKELSEPSETDEGLIGPTFDHVEAAPVEGYPHLYAYFASDLHYPEEAVRDSIQGTLSVSFIIDKNGKPEEILIENSLGPLFDLETVRLIQNMPAWKPATINGKTVPSRISLPLTFRILKPSPAKQK